MTVYKYYQENVGGKYICFQMKPLPHIISHTQRPKDRQFAKKLKEELALLLTYPEADISMYAKAAHVFISLKMNLFFQVMTGDDISLAFLPDGYDYFRHHTRFHIKRLTFDTWRMQEITQHD